MTRDDLVVAAGAVDAVVAVSGLVAPVPAVDAGVAVAAGDVDVDDGRGLEEIADDRIHHCRTAKNTLDTTVS